MCRIFGCVASEPVSVRHELLEARNPMIRQSQEHDSGWGMAVYGRTDGGEPHLVRFPQAAYADADFQRATERRGRIFNVHVRRATMGGLTLENTHPFVLGDYSFSHNGTVLHYTRLLEDGVAAPRGQTDSEHVFNFLMRDFDPADVAGSLRHAVLATVERSEFSGVNFLFSDGERLWAYRLGIFELHWLARAGSRDGSSAAGPRQLLVASERLTNEPWHSVQQDVLLTLDPDDAEEPHAERLIGDEALAKADIVKFEEGSELRGEARGEFAARRAERLASTTR